jgi:hypothetical protein
MDQVECSHHEHDDPDEPAAWAATDRHGNELGEYCAEHLGDGLDCFDGDVTLTRVNG